MSQDIIISMGRLTTVNRSIGDCTILPDCGDGTTLITENDWTLLISEYGSEEKLMKVLGVKEDLREKFGE